MENLENNEKENSENKELVNLENNEKVLAENNVIAYNPNNLSQEEFLKYKGNVLKNVNILKMLMIFNFLVSIFLAALFYFKIFTVVKEMVYLSYFYFAFSNIAPISCFFAIHVSIINNDLSISNKKEYNQLNERLIKMIPFLILLLLVIIALPILIYHFEKISIGLKYGLFYVTLYLILFSILINTSKNLKELFGKPKIKKIVNSNNVKISNNQILQIDTKYRKNDLFMLISAMAVIIEILVFIFGNYLKATELGIILAKISFFDAMFPNEETLSKLETESLQFASTFVKILTALIIIQIVLYAISVVKRFKNNLDSGSYSKNNLFIAFVNCAIVVLSMVLYFMSKASEGVKEDESMGADISFLGLVLIVALAIVALVMIIMSSHYLKRPNENNEVTFLNNIFVKQNINNVYNPNMQNPNMQNPNMQNYQIANQNNWQSSLAELEKLKELLDKGVITQEDYEAKKKEILKLK